MILEVSFMSNTVRCMLCEFEDNRRCIKKNIKVKINKPRHCGLYTESQSKLDLMMERKKWNPAPEVTVRPDHLIDKYGNIVREWDGTKYKKVKVDVGSASGGIAVSTPVDIPRAATAPPRVSDAAHPLTGDLSRFFKSTAGSRDEKQTDR